MSRRTSSKSRPRPAVKARRSSSTRSSARGRPHARNASASRRLFGAGEPAVENGGDDEQTQDEALVARRETADFREKSPRIVDVLDVGVAEPIDEHTRSSATWFG